MGCLRDFTRRAASRLTSTVRSKCLPTHLMVFKNFINALYQDDPLDPRSTRIARSPDRRDRAPIPLPSVEFEAIAPYFWFLKWHA